MEFTGERMVPTVEGFDDLFLEHVSRYIFVSRLVAGKDVLDAGCGAGYGARRLAGAGAASVLGIDVSAEAISYCREHYRREGLTYEVADILDTAFPDRSFDVVVSFEVFEHIADAGRFLAEMKRVLKPGGILALSTPNALTYVADGENGQNRFHVKEYTPGEFESFMANHFPEVRWYCQGPAGGVGIFPRLADDAPDSIGVEARLVAPPSESTWAPPIPLRSSRKRSSYMIALCSDRPLDPAVVPPGALFTLGDDLSGGTNAIDRLVRNRNDLARDVEERDAMIVHLQEELESRTTWAFDLQKEVDARDATIRRLQHEADALVGPLGATTGGVDALQKETGLMGNDRKFAEHGRAGRKR